MKTMRLLIVFLITSLYVHCMGAAGSKAPDLRTYDEIIQLYQQMFLRRRFATVKQLLSTPFVSNRAFRWVYGRSNLLLLKSENFCGLLNGISNAGWSLMAVKSRSPTRNIR